MDRMELIGITDAAAILQVGRTTVARFIEAGDLEVVATVGRRRVRALNRADVEKLAARRGVRVFDAAALEVMANRGEPNAND